MYISSTLHTYNILYMGFPPYPCDFPCHPIELGQNVTSVTSTRRRLHVWRCLDSWDFHETLDITQGLYIYDLFIYIILSIYIYIYVILDYI